MSIMVESDLDHIQLEHLTKRELEVLQRLAEGQSNQEIADALVVEVSTIKWYNSQIYGKLQVKNRKQAAIRAKTLGILEADSNDPLHRIQHNLPVDTLPFVGRKAEIKELVQQLMSDTIRLITILGPGGMGKSRLAIEVGRQLIPHFRDGVYFVSLVPVTSSEQIITTIAEIIGFKFYNDEKPKQQLLDTLQKQNILLIADNFEHLLDSAGLLTDILKVAPNVKMLTTSRETLNLSGEFLYSIRGLSVPFEEAVRGIPDYDGVKLFVEAAQRRSSQVPDYEMNTVANICQMLGGMPLAILLAAAWLDTLSLIEIEAEIKGGLDILEANLRDAPARHRSIEAVFDYSWQRLTEQEKIVFMRLSVFRDGFTRDAAKTITEASIRDLQRLVHTSFIQHLPSGRYAIHELMRQYGEQKLKASGNHDAICEKHAQYFANFIKPLGDTSWGMATPDMLEQVNVDFENVRAAWYFQVESKNIQELRRFLDGIWHFLDQYSRSKEGVDLFEPLLKIFQDKNDNETLFRGQLIARLGWLYNDIGQPAKSLELTKQALKIVEAFNSTNDILLINFGLYLIRTSVYESGKWRPYAEKGYELARKTNDVKWLLPMTVANSTWHDYLGQYEEAHQLINTIPEFKFRTTMETVMLIGRGKFTEAEKLIQNGLEKYHLHRIEYIIWHINLVKCAVHTKDYKKAWQYFQRGLQYGDDGTYAWGAFWMLREALSLHIIEKQYSPAAELLSLMWHHPSNVEWIRTSVSVHKDPIKTNLTVDEFDTAWERGKHLNLGDVITDYMER